MDRHHHYTATTIMTQNHHHHYQQNLTIISNNVQRGRQVTSKDIAHAIDYFEHFLNATSLKNILGYYRSICELLNLKPNHFQLFYPKLKNYLTSWRAKALWKKFDARSIHKCYGKGKICTNTRILIIGAGPCGLRTAIEAQLLGAKVVLIEKRDRLSRNNVLHLWPFVIEDLRGLGAKKFFGKFCAGSIDHISIRQLQCVLLKVALLLGVEVHTEISFERLIEPNPVDKTGWKAEFKPINHPVAQYEFDVVIGADGKRNTLQGFKRKEFRGKLAIAITANFINKRTEAEARVEEISGVAFIFNQKFFKDLYEDTGIDLENIVYYKDDTHYFVMTAKKPSLIDKGVIKQDLADTERLLAPDNVNREALMNYAREAANFSTNYQMPDLEFAVNHYGQPDVAMFDFTSMYAAENASKIVERHGYRLLMILVGDSLLEPFWPTGSGCARGFLSSLDAAWAIRSWSLGTMTPLEVIAERESIYRLLAQTTPDNLNKDWKAYTLDPTTRYPNLNKNVVIAHQVTSLYDTDNPKAIEKMKRNSQDLIPVDVPKKRRRGNVDSEILVNWVLEQIREHEDIILTDLASIFRNGKVLCAVINHYRPDLLDYNAIRDDDPVKNNQLAIDILEKEIGIPPIMTGEEITNTDDYLTMATYLTQVYDRFRGEIPHIKHPRLELPENQRNEPSFRALKHVPTIVQQTEIPPTITTRISNRHKRHADPLIQINNKGNSVERKTRKRRTLEKVSVSVEERQKTLEEIIANRTERQNKRKQQRRLKTEQFLKSMQMLQANAKPDASQPFEDYSIFLYRQTAPNFGDRVKDLERKFTYVPDHENKLPNQTRGSNNTDEDLAARIKSLEDKWKEPVPTEKKPKDLLRAIGKIETSDWNIKEIEKKIRENKLGKPSTNKDKEKVPKWSKEQFLARQTKMEKQHLDRQDSTEAKFADIDRNIKHLELKLKEGTSRDLGQNKVATITEKLVSKIPENEAKPVQKIQTRPAVVLPQGSEFCHFCGKRVYLMERLSAEGRFFHHGCFKCQYCHTQLRLGSYAFDRDGLYDHKFFCIHHYGMQGELKPNKVTRKPSQKQQRSPEKKLAGISGVDLLDRVRTPERIEFANLNNQLSDQDESLSQMDEDEWTDRNFGASTAELNTSDDESSSLSDTESDDEDAYEEALEEPATKEGTLKWAERFNKRYSRKRSDSESDDYSSSDHSSYYENTSDDEDSETATEGEEEIRARELRKQEVRVEPPVVQTDTGTDTEVKSPSNTLINNNDNDNNIKNNTKLSSSSDEFSSAQSGEFDNNHQNNFVLTKSATTGTVLGKPPKSQPIKDKRTFGNEFVSKFNINEPEPLLVIKRTPSKLNLPKEIGKPKVAVNVNIENAKKYFGDTPTKPKSILKRCETINTAILNPKMVKQISLPERNTVEIKPKIEQNQDKSFNFEPIEDDLNNIDDYIENLLANEDELMKPIDPDKFKVQEQPQEVVSTDDETISNSIEDLFKALETETKAKDIETAKKSDEKLEDLLTWIEELEHQSEENNTKSQLYRSFSDAKYKNLERVLKVPKRADSVVNRIPKDNIKYFEQYLSGKSTINRDNNDNNTDIRGRKFSLTRSKTEIYCNKSRNSVDLDAVSNVDIRKVLMKFENNNSDNNIDRKDDRPKFNGNKRFSLVNFKQNSQDFIGRRSSNFEDTIQDYQNFIDNIDKKPEKSIKNDCAKIEEPEEKNWCVNITVSTIPNLEFVNLESGDNGDNKSSTNIEEIQQFDKENSNIEDNVNDIAVKVEIKENSDSSDTSEESEEINDENDNKASDNTEEIRQVDNEENCNDENVEENNENDADNKVEIEVNFGNNCANEKLEETNGAILAHKSTENIEEIQKNDKNSDTDNNNEDVDNTNEKLKEVDTNYNAEPVDNTKDIQIMNDDNNTTFVTEEILKTEQISNKSNETNKTDKSSNNDELNGSNSNEPSEGGSSTLNKTAEIEENPPTVPQRLRKKSTETPPSKPIRQKSLEQKHKEIELTLPQVPQRKQRAISASPLPQKRSNLLSPNNFNKDNRSSSTTDLSGNKVMVKSYQLATPQVPIRTKSKLNGRSNDSKDKDKDCCLQ